MNQILYRQNQIFQVPYLKKKENHWKNRKIALCYLNSVFLNDCGECRTLKILAEGKRYCAGLAADSGERCAAYRLRHRVFCAELGRLRGAAGNSGDREHDAFDDACEQLIVVERDSGGTVGCYRLMRPGGNGGNGGNGGFASEREFEFRGLAAIAPEAVELGRSCIAPEHRNGAVIALLWAGLGALHRAWRFRYLFGCVSFAPEEAASAVGWRRRAEREGRVFGPVSAVPRPGFEPTAADFGVENSGDGGPLRAPPLFKGYWRLGAMLMGEPACDREFGSVDLPIVLDFVRLPQKYARHFRTEDGGI